MATYDLNQVLKDREKNRKPAGNKEKELDLGDVSRVKVLSPGRQVFKRFIRNRLAVFGSVTLIVLFLFSFVGPLFYPYGQKEIFYTYQAQNVNYALAKENTAYNGYDADASLQIERTVVNAMNSNIKKMISEDQSEIIVNGKEGSYLIRRELPGIYTLSVQETEPVCTTGTSSVKVGTYVMVGKTFTPEGDEIPGLAEEAAKIKGTSGSFEVDGQTFTFEKGDKPKTYDIFTEQDGIVYAGEAMDAGFEEVLQAAVDAGEGTFEYEGDIYALSKNGSSWDVVRTGDASAAKVYTNYTLDTFETGVKVPDDLRPAALMAVVEAANEDGSEMTGDGTFECDGSTWTIREDEAGLTVLDMSGNEYAEFGLFSIRRYSGEDTMAYDLKRVLAEKIEDMLEKGEKTGTVTASIPMQEADGSYSVGEDGQYILNETEMKITQRLEGEYVINCDQINYVIDMFAPPSVKHILGTDGDGFDVLARVMYGGRISLMVGFIVVLIEIVLGVIMGGLAGYFGGWVDNLIMRLVDIFYCLPSLPIMIILGAMMDAIRLDTYIRLMVMMAALGLMGWAGVARMVRGQILSLREQEFMVATEATGIRIKDRIFKHLIPNVMPQLIVIATMGLGGVILTESTLSFLGLGVKHPLATWGTIINSVSSASAMAHYAFIWIPVGLLICFTVIAFNFVGDGLRDAYDPKSKR